MSRRDRRIRTTAVILAATVLAVPAAATAAVTASSITSPAGPVIYPVYDASSPTTVPFSGSATGTGSVRIACTFTDSEGGQQASGSVSAPVAVSAGAFAVTATPGAVQTLPCRTRALPTGPAPLDLTPFQGPLSLSQYRETFTVGGIGPNAGQLRELYYGIQQRTSSTVIDGIASCGLCQLAWVDTVPTTPQRGQDTWSTGGSFYPGFLGNPVERTYAQIDGHRSFFSGDVGGPLNADPNFPGLTTTFTPADGVNAPVVTERVEPVRCPDDAVTGLSPGECATLTKLGVRFDRTFTGSPDGRWWLLEDTVTSTDGLAHQLDLHYANYTNSGPFPFNPGLAVPWAPDPGFTSSGVPRTFGAPATLPASLFVDIGLDTPDGAPTAPAGSLTVGPGFVGASVSEYDGGNGEILMKFTRTVPAGGSTVIRQAFSATRTQAEAQTAAAQAEQRIRDLTATLGPPQPAAPAGAGPSSTSTSAADTTAPSITGARLSKTAFAKGAKGVSFSFRSSEAGGVRLVISRRVAGRRKGRGCVAPTTALRGARSCTRLVKVKTIAKPATGGANALAVPTRSFAPGRYTATLTVTDAAGNTAAPVAKTFTVTKPQPRRR